jgi:hypothetical protein
MEFRSCVLLPPYRCIRVSRTSRKTLTINLVSKIWDIQHTKLQSSSYLKEFSNVIVIMANILYFINQIIGQTFLEICNTLITSMEVVVSLVICSVVPKY